METTTPAPEAPKRLFTPRELLRNIRFALAVYWHDRKPLLIIAAFAVILRVLQPYLGILMPKVVIDQLEAHVTPTAFIAAVGTLAVALVVVNYVKSYADFLVNNGTGTLGIFGFILKQSDKRMSMDYEQLENPALKTIEEKSDKAIQSNHSLAMNVPRTLVQLLSNTAGFLLYAFVISTVHPLILVVLLGSAAINWLALSRARRYMEDTREARSKVDGKISALQEALRNPKSAKDIRLYGALDWLHAVLMNLFDERVRGERAVLTRQMRAQLVDALLILVRDGAAYAYLIYLLLAGQIALGDFVLVFAAIGAVAGWISGILVAASDLAKSNIEMSDIRTFLEFPDRMNTGAGVALPTGDELPPGLSLRGVSYTYPSADKPTLQDIDIDIRPGERIAIVGANGAGKTTLVKLLCGLYAPTTGTVALAGRDANAYNRDDYYTMFSAVFQDIHLLSCDIAGNVSQAPPEDTDDARVRRCLELSGLREKVDKLPNRERTMLVRSINMDAVELSGGEMQKLAMARALYKDAPVILLDEPTAALDPIAENEVYQKYADLTEGKTSVFISHRLASTRFCDRILLIDGSRIAEQGSHDELMRLGGVYAHMFEVQASYYQEERKEAEVHG